jgi:transcription elongation factor GreA
MKYLTKESHKEISQELEDRKFKVRKEISNQIREAKELGDLSENASYKEAREQESFNEARIEELERILREAKVVGEAHIADVVEIGDSVELTNGLSFELVDSSQATPPAKISIESPLGRAVFGRKVGDEFEVKLPDNKIQTYKIKKILE